MSTEPVPAVPAVPTALDEYVQRIVDAAPPLTPEQRDRLTLLLSPYVRQRS